jgi:hypothetical protein
MTSFPQLSNFLVSPRHRRGLSRLGQVPAGARHSRAGTLHLPRANQDIDATQHGRQMQVVRTENPI